jgi:Carboxypeptidase regulatory-like domain
MKKIGRILAAGTACALVLAMAARAGAESSDLSFVVTRDYNGKPIKNASVILHPVNGRGKQERGGFELKTDTDGKTSFNGVPYGTLRVQVLAPGFQTYGEDFNINQAQMTIAVKLKRPSGQYSVYDDKNNPSAPKAEDKKPPETPDQKPQ